MSRAMLAAAIGISASWWGWETYRGQPAPNPSAKRKMRKNRARLLTAQRMAELAANPKEGRK